LLNNKLGGGGMFAKAFLIAILSGAIVWFWPNLRAVLAEQDWAQGAVTAIDQATDQIPRPPTLRGPQTAAAVIKEELSGRVVAVADGDTFTLAAADNKRVRVRLSQVDAPDRGKPWGRSAKRALSSLVLSKTVRVVASGRDLGGHTLGRVFVKDVDVNAEMVRRGAAYAYREYLSDALLVSVEDEARTARRGMWSLRSAASHRPVEGLATGSPPANCVPDRALGSSREAALQPAVMLGASLVAPMQLATARATLP
jgi:endonuclease YncB( thermonuclease family)